MLPQFILLAGAIQAALANAHFAKAESERGLLVDLNSPGYAHKHLVPSKRKMNMAEEHGFHHQGHGHSRSIRHAGNPQYHKVHAHKRKYDNNELGDKLHGGPDELHHTRTPGVNDKVDIDHGNEARAIDDIAPYKGEGYPSIGSPQVGGNAILANRCNYDVWMWSVEESYSSPRIYVPARTIYSEPKRAPAKGGVVFKISRSNQLTAGLHTQFEYSISENMMYYDISFVDCATGNTAQNCPGWDMGLSIASPEPACKTVNCPSNSYCTEAAYFVDTPFKKLGIAEPVFGCGAAGSGMDIYFHTCSDTPELNSREAATNTVAGRISVG